MTVKVSPILREVKDLDCNMQVLLVRRMICLQVGHVPFRFILMARDAKDMDDYDCTYCMYVMLMDVLLFLNLF